MKPTVVKPNVIVICGPTALGKTSIAIDLARTFNGEIVGADSMQIYRNMNIGTAKPTPYEQSRVPHHMIDIVDPDEPFDARRFAIMAHEKIMDLHARRVTPFVIGGTGLYIKALLHGLFEAMPADRDVRARLKQEAEIHGTGFLHKRLSQQDSATAKRIHPNDTYRILRALEVYELTGKPITELQSEHRFTDKPFRVVKIGLHMDRDIIYDRINHRVDAMIDSGLVDEVKGLLGMGYSADLKSMQSIGYRHMVDFIEGHSSWEEALRTLKRDTRRYAKRQLTWFKADSAIVWKEPGQLKEIRRTIEKFLQVH
jgi:tRNA dimethylallyltransferase